MFHNWFRNTEHGEGHPVPVKVTHYKYIGERLLIIDVVSPKWQTTILEDKYVFELEDLTFGFFVVESINDREPVDWAEFREHFSFTRKFVGMGYIVTDGNRMLNPSGFHGLRDVFIEYRHNSMLRIEVHRSLYDRITAVFENASFQ